MLRGRLRPPGEHRLEVLGFIGEGAGAAHHHLIDVGPGEDGVQVHIAVGGHLKLRRCGTARRVGGLVGPHRVGHKAEHRVRLCALDRCGCVHNEGTDTFPHPVVIAHGRAFAAVEAHALGGLLVVIAGQVNAVGLAAAHHLAQNGGGGLDGRGAQVCAGAILSLFVQPAGSIENHIKGKPLPPCRLGRITKQIIIAGHRPAFAGKKRPVGGIGGHQHSVHAVLRYLCQRRVQLCLALAFPGGRVKILPRLEDHRLHLGRGRCLRRGLFFSKNRAAAQQHRANQSGGDPPQCALHMPTSLHNNLYFLSYPHTIRFLGQNQAKGNISPAFQSV